MNHRISMIAALGTDTRAIGKDNDLIWDIPEDKKRFRTITKGHPVIMGRKTWKSLPSQFRPLPGRANIVISRDPNYEALGAVTCTSLAKALDIARMAPGNDEIFIIGGGEIYTEGLAHADRLYLTLVDDSAKGDVFFPDYSQFTKQVELETHSRSTPHYTFVTLEKTKEFA